MTRSIIVAALLAGAAPTLAAGPLPPTGPAPDPNAPSSVLGPVLPPVLPPGVIGAPAGTGRWPAVAEARADAKGYTVYHPARMPAERLPLVLWGNGGCKDNGLSASHFLREVASHGYFVVANGAPRAERPVLAALPAGGGRQPGALSITVADETTVAHLLAAIDWARAADRAGPFAGRIDTGRIAVMGHSCGGLQTIAAAADPRISTAVVYDSGIYNVPHEVPGRMHLDKSDLKRLHTPIAYVLGGQADIAYANGDDDVRRIDTVPVFYANLPVGHGGTFQLADGGDWAKLGVAWLDWQLKHVAIAGHQFTDQDCILCRDPRWTIVRKQFPGSP
ncbi:hypothetical protein [Novosphingobium sp.]|uniref:hypothetical protein n=1 Tax=Novosphingobium sp. TaxID=1874826 RepID=UPI0025D5E01A|nr:hypothetical protein [Novosphingobium sp.]